MRERWSERAVVATLAALAALAVLAGSALRVFPAGAATGAPAWLPAPRDLRHASVWVLAGERRSRRIGRAHPEVLFVGDSITQWWLRFGTRAWTTDFAPLGAADDGVAGDTTSNVLARIDDGSLTGAHPRVVVVMVGTNNIPLHQHPAEIARGVLAVTAALHRRLAGARMLLLAVLPRGEPGSADRRAVGAVDRRLVAAAAAARLAYLDLGPTLLGPGGRFLPGVMHTDLLHPATGGYDRMAARLAPAVRRLLAGGPA